MHAVARLMLDGAHLKLQLADLLRESLHIGMHATGAPAFTHTSLRACSEQAYVLLLRTQAYEQSDAEPCHIHTRASALAALQLRADQVSTHRAINCWYMRRFEEACTHAEL